METCRYASGNTWQGDEGRELPLPTLLFGPYGLHLPLGLIFLAAQVAVSHRWDVGTAGLGAARGRVPGPSSSGHQVFPFQGTPEQ